MRGWIRGPAVVASVACAGVLLSTAVAAEPTISTAKPSISWAACEGDNVPAGMRCATIEVPVNWAKPGGRKIPVKLARLPATGQTNRIGTVVSVPGGPGGSGISTLTRAAPHFAALRERFDVVTLDPRNTAFRDELPLSCYTTGPSLFLPDNRKEYDALARANQESAQQCRQHDQEYFDNLDSASFARDMEVIRVALGEQKLSFIATSYGGRPAIDYARLFPNRVRAMFMDGTGNPLSDHTAEDRYKYPLIEEQFARFVDWCAATADCVLHGEDVGAVWRKLVADADRSPIPVGGQPPEAAYNGFDLKYGIAPYLQSPHKAPPGGSDTPPSEFPGYLVIARAIDKARQGDASDFAKAVLASFGTPKVPAVPGPLVPGCLDGGGYRDYTQYRESRLLSRKLSPNFEGKWQWHPLACAGWPSRITNPSRPLPPNSGVPPLLGVGTWSDFGDLDDLMEQVPGSVSFRVDSQGHAMYNSGQKCAIEHANRYLTDLTLPPAGTICQP